MRSIGCTPKDRKAQCRRSRLPTGKVLLFAYRAEQKLSRAGRKARTTLRRFSRFILPKLRIPVTALLFVSTSPIIPSVPVGSEEFIEFADSLSDFLLLEPLRIGETWENNSKVGEWELPFMKACYWVYTLVSPIGEAAASLKGATARLVRPDLWVVWILLLVSGVPSAISVLFLTVVSVKAIAAYEDGFKETKRVASAPGENDYRFMRSYGQFAGYFEWQVREIESLGLNRWVRFCTLCKAPKHVYVLPPKAKWPRWFKPVGVYTSRKPRKRNLVQRNRRWYST
jgi:hypothetical protein